MVFLFRCYGVGCVAGFSFVTMVAGWGAIADQGCCMLVYYSLGANFFCVWVATLQIRVGVRGPGCRIGLGLVGTFLFVWSRALNSRVEVEERKR